MTLKGSQLSNAQCATWKIWKKGKLSSEKIWKIQKKGKLKCEKIWKMWKKVD